MYAICASCHHFYSLEFQGTESLLFHLDRISAGDQQVKKELSSIIGLGRSNTGRGGQGNLCSQHHTASLIENCSSQVPFNRGFLCCADTCRTQQESTD